MYAIAHCRTADGILYHTAEPFAFQVDRERSRPSGGVHECLRVNNNFHIMITGRTRGTIAPALKSQLTSLLQNDTILGFEESPHAF